jgi:hypothetical protein
MKAVALIIILFVVAVFAIGSFGMAYNESKLRKSERENPDNE